MTDVKKVCPECRVCHHRHPSWFEDSDGIICDWCLNNIPCPTRTGEVIQRYRQFDSGLSNKVDVKLPCSYE